MKEVRQGRVVDGLIDGRAFVVDRDGVVENIGTAPFPIFRAFIKEARHIRDIKWVSEGIRIALDHMPKQLTRGV